MFVYSVCISLSYLRIYFAARSQMKKIVALGLAFPLYFNINKVSSTLFIEYPGLGVEDPPKAGLKVKSRLNIKDIMVAVGTILANSLSHRS